MTNTDTLTHAKAMVDLDAIPTAALDRLLRDIGELHDDEGEETERFDGCE